MSLSSWLQSFWQQWQWQGHSLEGGVEVDIREDQSPGALLLKLLVLPTNTKQYRAKQQRQL